MDTESMASRSKAKGARVGAFSAACLTIIAITIPTLVAVIISPRMVGWLPLVFWYSIPWVVAAAILGAILGRFASQASDAVSSSLIGVAFSLPLVLVYSALFVTAQENQQVNTSFKIFLFASSIGAITGWASWKSGNGQPSGVESRQFQISLTDIFLLVSALAVYLCSLTS